MKLSHYACSHCGRRFEAEEKEIVECPGCYWTSSVKPADEVAEPYSKIHIPPSARRGFTFALPKLSLPNIPAGALKVIASGLLLFAATFGLVRWVLPLAGNLFTKSNNAVSVNKKSGEGKSSEAKEAVHKSGDSSKPGLGALSPEDQNILNRRIQVSADRVPSEEEQKTLSARAAFKSGFSEKLPSQAWTLANFKEMIAQQEKFYQVPLPHSYKSKLYELFQKKYLPGAEAFKNGDLIQARDLWVASLAFPIYANNPQKHRGVALTMLRPFITDTLSKIGTINSAAVEKSLREKEQAVVFAYEKIFSLIEQKNWPAGVSATGDLNQALDQFFNPIQISEKPAPYPKDIAQVDSDIRATLTGLLNVPPPAVSDLEPLRIDALRKRRVMESFIPEKLQARQQKYDEGMDALGRGDWAEAIESFKSVDLPDELSLDAGEKIKVLRKLQNSLPDAHPQGAVSRKGQHEGNPQPAK